MKSNDGWLTKRGPERRSRPSGRGYMDFRSGEEQRSRPTAGQVAPNPHPLASDADRIQKDREVAWDKLHNCGLITYGDWSKLGSTLDNLLDQAVELMGLDLSDKE